MNKVFKVIWNVALNRYDVVSEFSMAGKKCKSSVDMSISPSARKPLCLKSSVRLNKIALILMLSFCNHSAFSEEVDVPNFTPQVDFEQMFTGSNNNLNGSFSKVASGKAGFVTTTLGKLDPSLISEGKELINFNRLTLGQQTKKAEYIDPITGNRVNVEVYDNEKMLSTPASNIVVTTPIGVGVDGQYIDRRFFVIRPNSELTVNVGDKTSDWTSDSANYFNAILKGTQKAVTTSSVFHVVSDDTSLGNTTLNYNSKTIVNLGNRSNNISNTSSYAASFVTDDYSGKFSSILGMQTVENISDFKKFNDALIASISDGNPFGLNKKTYAAELAKALKNNNTAQKIFLDPKITADDAINHSVNKDQVAFIHGVGEKSVVNIHSGANIQIYNTDSSLIRLTNGATVNNEGVLGSAASTISGSYVISATDSIINNTSGGIIDAGTNDEVAIFAINNKKDVATGSHTAILANGDSRVTNDGIINVASHGSSVASTAVLLSDTAILTNNGSINLASTKEGSNIQGGFYNRGIITQGKSSFINNGVIYIGREAQRALGQLTNNLLTMLPSYAVYLSQNGKFNNTTSGEIIIGENTGGSTGIDVQGVNTEVNQAGVITINGINPASNSLNIGIYSHDKSINVNNSGAINLNGSNAIGIKIFSDTNKSSNSAAANSSGEININGGVDSNGYANYGIWAEGKNAVANLTGNVNLSGDGTIGIHARNEGIVNVTDGGHVIFKSGKNQIGYYVYGAGSQLNNSSTGSEEVSTENSILYRIDNGANFTGANASTVNVSGANASAFQITGQGSTFDSGAQTFNIGGSDASGVRVEGGAKGNIAADAIFNLSGANSSAAIVDGKFYSITGLATGVIGKSELTSAAKLTTGNTATVAHGYIIRNGGQLNHAGSIDFSQAGSSGVLVNDGILNNTGDISVNGTAVSIQGSSSDVNNTGTVQATDGTAAFLLGKGVSLRLTGTGETKAGGSAHGVLLDTGATALTVEGAKITMSDGGNGNAIENKAEISGIHLKDTVLNVGNGAGVRTGTSMATTNSGVINVNGSGTGILFANAEDTLTDNALDMSDSADLVINVNSANGKGMVTRSREDLKTGVSVNINDAAGGSALIVKGTTGNVEQSGKLVSQSLTNPVVDINNGFVTGFVNRGSILANSVAQEAINSTAGNGIAFKNQTGAEILGQVNLLAGTNTVTLMKGSKGTDFTTGSGNDAYVLKLLTKDDAAVFTSLNGGEGADTLTFDTSFYALSDANKIRNMENINLLHNSTLILDNVLLPLGDDQLDGPGTGYHIESGSLLHVNNTNEVNFTSKLSGAGTVTVDTSAKAFNFTENSSKNAFSGVLALGKTLFNLAADNTVALTNATLNAGTDSVTRVGDGIQTIGGLAFDGGAVSFNTGTPGETFAKSSIHTTNNMDIRGAGTVKVNIGSVDNTQTGVNHSLSILEQDDSNTQLQLASNSGEIQGSGGNLVLKDQDDNLITNSTTADIAQNGMTVAKGTYDYRLTSGADNDGLYVGYGLTQVDLLGSAENALSLFVNDKAGNASDLSARVTGSGDLAIETGKDNSVSLSNQDNDYTGQTEVRSGTLVMLNNNALGNTSLVSLASETALDMKGHHQTVGELNGMSGSFLDLNGGDLILANGGLSDGTLSGNGSLKVEENTLVINGANTALNAGITIARDGQIAMNDAAGLGQGSIANAGVLTLDGVNGQLSNTLSEAGNVILDNSSSVTLTGDNSLFSGLFDISGDSELTLSQGENLGGAAVNNGGAMVLDTASDWTLANVVTGGGNLIKAGAGVVTLTSSTAYTGQTDINSGGLTLGSRENPMLLASQRVNVAEGAFMAGFGGVAGAVDNKGTLFVGEPVQSISRALPGTHVFTVGTDLSNSGEVVVGNTTRSGGAEVGNQLVINGNYAGDNGLLHFNTVLGDDNSVTDSMIVKGDTSGNTFVSVENVGGLGAKTLNGIELIQVSGMSEGEFVQKGRIVAGAYDYSLQRGTGENAANWYLSNQGDGSVEPEKPGEPETPVVPVKPTPPTTPGSSGGETQRPESASYTANLAAANTMFLTRLHDRLGETQYIDALTGEQKVTSMWMRNVGGHTRSNDASGQLKTQSNRYVLQMGGDIARWSNNDRDRLHLGIMAGYGNNKSNTHSNRSGYNSHGAVDGYSVGAYGTWYANDEDKSGLYVDSWAQYSWFNNTVSGEGLSSEKYKSKGMTASLESGYTFNLGQSQDKKKTYFIQPKAQVTWMGIKADEHREANGTRVSGQGDGNIQTRLGVRAYLKGHHAIDNGKDREFEPFVETNWIHNIEDFGTAMNGSEVKQTGAKNIGELKLGVEGQISKKLNMWGNVGQQMGDKGYSDTSVMLGIKYNF